MSEKRTRVGHPIEQPGIPSVTVIAVEHPTATGHSLWSKTKYCTNILMKYDLLTVTDFDTSLVQQKTFYICDIPTTWTYTGALLVYLHLSHRPLHYLYVEGTTCHRIPVCPYIHVHHPSLIKHHCPSSCPFEADQVYQERTAAGGRLWRRPQLMLTWRSSGSCCCP